MASIGAKAEMDKVATNRLEAAIGTLSLRFGLVRPEPRNSAGDNHLKAIYDREDFATLLEQLVEKTVPEAKTLGSGAEMFYRTVAEYTLPDEPAEEVPEPPKTPETKSTPRRDSRRK